MTAKIFYSTLKGLALFSLIFFGTNFSYAQNTCQSAPNDTVTVNDIGTVTVEGTNQRSKAVKIYKKGLAQAAQDAGSCSGSCTVGNCIAVFEGYSGGSHTPPGSGSGAGSSGTFTFDAPPGGSLTFIVSCDCRLRVTKVQIKILNYDGEEHQQKLKENGDRLSPKDNSAYLFFPNPTTDQVNLLAELPAIDGAISLQLINLQGQVVMEEQLGTLPQGSHQFNFDIDELTPGIYIGSVYADGKVLSQTRIVVQH